MATAALRRRVSNGPGAGQWLALCGASLVVLALTFALGLLVGRQWARQSLPLPAAGEPAPGPAASPRRSGLAEVVVDRPPELQDRLTFYKTLTAPLDAVPSAAKVEPVQKPSPAPKPAPAPAATATVKPTSVSPAAPAVSLPRPVEGAPDRNGEPAAAVRASAPAQQWTVQVGAFKSRRQAEGVHKRLAAAGFDAYLINGAGEDGQGRYRVRVGSFKTRDEALKVAERVRAEHSLTAFVTPK